MSTKFSLLLRHAFSLAQEERVCHTVVLHQRSKLLLFRLGRHSLPEHRVLLTRERPHVRMHALAAAEVLTIFVNVSRRQVDLCFTRVTLFVPPHAGVCSRAPFLEIAVLNVPLRTARDAAETFLVAVSVEDFFALLTSPFKSWL
ncbi:MAG: hypothetical protein AAB649_02495 [Patescibacteria group bacterium]